MERERFALENGLVYFTISVVTFTILFRFLDGLVEAGRLVGKDLPEKKRYSIVFRLARFISNAIGLAVEAPALLSVVTYIFSDDVRLHMLDPSHKHRLIFGGAATLGPIVFDLCARSELQLPSMLHHVLSVLIPMLAGDWDLGVEVGIFHVLASLLELPVHYTFYLMGTNTEPLRCAWWLKVSRRWVMCVKGLAQLAIVSILAKTYRSQVATTGFQLFTLAEFMIGLTLNVLIFSTQAYSITALGTIRRGQLAKAAKENTAA